MKTIVALRPLERQRGAATLVIAMILLFSLTLLTLFAGRVSVTEHQIAGNEYRAKQAFEAAQGGIEYGFNELQSNGGLWISEADAGTNSANDLLAAIGQVRLDGTPGTVTDGSSYTLQYDTVDNNNFSLIRVTSVGISVDGGATKTVRQLVQFNPILTNTPNSSMVARDSINISGNVTFTNTETNSTALAGDGVTLGGSAGCTTGEAGNEGITQNDGTLAGMTTGDEFFEHFFGDTKENVRAMSTEIACSGVCNGQLDGHVGEILWVTGDTVINSNTVIGSPEHPVILIVTEGNLELRGGATIYGLVYSESGWNNGAGNANVVGASLVESDFEANGSLTISYNSDVLSRIRNGLGSFAKVAGGWQDF